MLWEPGVSAGEEWNKYYYKSYSNLTFITYVYKYMDFPSGSDGKKSACNAGDLSLIPGSGKSPGEGMAMNIHNKF